jgi:ribosomal protein L24E
MSSILFLTAWCAALSLPLSVARATTGPQDVFAFGDAPFYGSTGALPLTKPVAGMAASPSGRGYWLVATDGGVFSFGDARFFGSTGAVRLNRPIVGMAASPTGHGYWFVAADGGVFSFGDARFFGSTGGLRLSRPIVGMAASPTGRGYRFVASDGGIFSFGDAGYHGSLGAAAPGQPVVAMDTTRSGDGYWLATADGAVAGFGDAAALKPLAAAAVPAAQRIIGMAGDPTDRGYWLASTTAMVPNPKVEAAIAWYTSRLGQATYTGQCELAVENAYGTDSAYANAFSDWNAQPVRHPDWQNAPRGALVFYDTSADGHVAISLGDGRVVSTSVNGRIGIVATGYFQNPLGWAVSPFV